MNLTGQPIYQKGAKPAKARKPMRCVSAKKAADRDAKYLAAVKTLPCVICGAYGVDAHHCRSQPAADEPHAYERLPAAGRRSHDRDAIPLCPHDCHNGGPNSYHVNKRAWEERNGPDYGFIPSTRAAVKAMRGTIDF